MDQSYIVAGVPYVYLWSKISPTDLPDVAAFLAEYKYPPELPDDEDFFIGLHIALEDIITPLGAVPTNECLLGDNPLRFAVNSCQDDQFDHLQVMLEEEMYRFKI